MTTPDAHGWLPIESAPKDGTEVLVIHAGKSTVRGRSYHTAVDFWHRVGKHGFEGWGCFNRTYYPATHWQPLPNPPVSEPSL